MTRKFEGTTLPDLCIGSIMHGRDMTGVGHLLHTAVLFYRWWTEELGPELSLNPVHRVAVLAPCLHQ